MNDEMSKPALCAVGVILLSFPILTYGVHGGNLRSTNAVAGMKWHGPNAALPVRAQSPSWADVRQAAGYRIQRHRLFGYCRLLDPANVRLGWGSRQYCEELLDRRLRNSDPPRRRFNLRFPTLGGYQFWGDEMVYCGWRIQRSAIFGYYRLLDPWCFRRAWGTYEECDAAFRSLVKPQILRPRSDEVVIVLHGLFRTRRSSRQLEKFLLRQGYEVVAVGYPSARVPIEADGAQLARLIERLTHARKIHFVTHSLGGIVVRCYLRDHRDPRIGRLVMIAPPNRGSYISKHLSARSPFRIFAGPAGEQLTRDEFFATLPEPWCEFGVIAGGRGDGRGYSPLLPGDDDGVVLVEETHLDGMRDFLLVPRIHTFIMNDQRVKRAVVRFLRAGQFGAPRQDTKLP